MPHDKRLIERKTKMKILTYECDKCGSDDLTWDAHACWDVENQCMELASHYDECFCRKCNEYCNQIEKEVSASAAR